MKKLFQDFLEPTLTINSNDPFIIRKSAEIFGDAKSAIEKAEKLFYFVRDEIRYVFRADLQPEMYRASNILKNGRGFCTQKAIVFCALARSCGIPSGIHFYNIVDYTLPKHFAELLKTNVMYRHGVTALFLNGKWLKYDATLDINLVNNNGIIPVEFSPDKDCLMKKLTNDGKKHIEYIKDFGLYSDVKFEQIYQWFDEYYPHITAYVRKKINSI